MRALINVLFLLLGMSCVPLSICLSQQDSTAPPPTRIILRDGSELIGSIVQEDSVSILFKTAGNIDMTIPREQVKERDVLSGEIVGERYIRRDPNDTRLLFAPTARPLKAGQGYFSAYEVFFPFLAVGIADVATLAGGMSIFPGASDQLFYLAPKITPLAIDNFSLAGGMLYINTTAGTTDGVGFFYGVGTYGTSKAAVTFGLGWGFYGSDIADKPVVMLGGELRLSNSIKLISENWIPPNSDFALVSLGIRFFGENLAADLGFIRITGTRTEGFPFIPWLGFAYNFGGN